MKFSRAELPNDSTYRGFYSSYVDDYSKFKYDLSNNVPEALKVHEQFIAFLVVRRLES